MVLESILGAMAVRKHPLYILFLSIVLSSLGIWVSYFIFPESAGMLSLAFITIALMPVFHAIFTAEEEEEVEMPGSAATFLERHFDIIKIIAWFFVGLVISYSFWYVALPEKSSTVCITPAICLNMPGKDKVFSEQETVFKDMQHKRQALMGKVAEAAKPQKAGYWTTVEMIFANNAKVLILAIALSFIFGAGALFLLAWNASFIGLVIGKEILKADLFAGVLVSIGLLPHGIPELAAYFIGVVAGGIISVAISKKKYKTHEFEIISKDVVVLLVISFVLLFAGALIEAWIIVA